MRKIRNMRTRSANSAGTMTGMVVGLAVSLTVGQLVAPRLFGWPGVAWTWNVAIGAIVTFAVGLVASRALARPAAEPATP